MAEIDLNALRTTEDVINALSVLYFNLNEIERIYYDMFLNTEPMDVTFQRYDDKGVLEIIKLPNRAKDTRGSLTGSGSPNGVVSASIGVFYIDIDSLSIYYKSAGTDAFGWVLVWSSSNFIAGTNYQSPTGDASRLTNLNMSNAGSGVLGVLRGGTGSGGISGLVKGNGTSAMTAAVDGVDYLGPATLAGIIAYYPVASIPAGWLMCDGAAYSRTTYSRLFGKIGTTYGEGDGNTTFNVPNLMDDGNGNPYYIRCWKSGSAFNTEYKDQPGAHVHGFAEGTTTGNEGSEDGLTGHTHTRGNMNITGKFGAINTVGGYTIEGAFTDLGRAYDCDWDNIGGRLVGFDASRTWQGTTSGGSPHSHPLENVVTAENETTGGTETRVLSKMLVPVIKF